jgi:hypothetical protein
VILRHDRRDLIHIGVTDRPTAPWAAQQIVHAFPDETGPAYLLRDRDAIYGPTSRAGSSAWAFARSSSHLARPGRMPSPSASSARFAANASTSSSCSTNATCVACFALTSRTPTLRGLTRVSITTARAGASTVGPLRAYRLRPRGRRASSPLPARGLTARGPRLPAPPRSSVQAGLSWVDTVIRRCPRCRHPCRFRRGRSRGRHERFASSYYPFDRDTVLATAFSRKPPITNQVGPQTLYAHVSAMDEKEATASLTARFSAGPAPPAWPSATTCTRRARPRHLRDPVRG